jgi:hypothetical protein
MALGQLVINTLINLFLNNWAFFVIIGTMMIVCSQWYEDYFRTNRNTDNIDLMKRYLDIKIRRRYRGSRI